MSDPLETTDELIAERRSDAGGGLPPDMPLWMAGTITLIDRLSLWAGRIVCVLVLPIMAAMVYEIFVRKVFVAPTLWAYDISRMLYGALFVLGAGYALSKGVHIRADFIYRNWRPRTQGLVDLTLYILFFFPGSSSSCRSPGFSPRRLSSAARPPWTPPGRRWSGRSRARCRWASSCF